MDVVSFYVYDFKESKTEDKYKLLYFPVLSRILTGYPSLHDEYSAAGERIKKIVTDLGVTEEVDQEQVKKNTEDIQKNSSDISELGGRVDSIEVNSLKVESVTTLPAEPDPNTIYLIQGSAG